MIKPEKLIAALRETDDYIKIIYLHGGCYQFYKFLKAVYPQAEPYISGSHVVTKIGNRYYDIRGAVRGKYRPLTAEDTEKCEKWSFSKNNWLARYCLNCGEPVAGRYVI